MTTSFKSFFKFKCPLETWLEFEDSFQFFSSFIVNNRSDFPYFSFILYYENIFLQTFSKKYFFFFNFANF